MGEHGGRPLLEASAEVLLDACFASAPVGFGVLDEDLRWVRANRVLAALNGVPARNHVGRRLTEVGGAFAAEIEPLLRRALDGHAAVDVRVQSTGDDPLRVSCFPLGNDERARGAGVVVVEGGDGPRARLSLRLSEERLRLALEGTQTGTWEWERDTDAVSWSASVGPLFGLERGAPAPGYDE
jgi:PAS domain-containing protein